MLKQTLLVLTAFFLLCTFSNIIEGQNKVVSIDIVPDRVTLNPGESLQFKAQGKNNKDEVIPFSPEWAAVGGKIDQRGRFTAGNKAGVYSVTATDSSTGVQGSAGIRIAFIQNAVVKEGNDKIVKLKLIPQEVKLKPGRTMQFKVEVFNDSKKKVALTTRLKWRGAGGSIRSDGFYRAGGVPGTYVIMVRIPNGPIAKAKVVVLGKLGQIKNIKVTPSSALLKPYETKRFFATGYDSSGKIVQFQASWEATGGKIDLKGVFAAGSNPGSFYVRAKSLEGVSGTAPIKIEKQDIVRVEVEPQNASLKYGQKQKFEVKAYDSSGKVVQAFPAWSATGGEIRTDGVYTAGKTPGEYWLTLHIDKFTVKIPVLIVRKKEKPVKFDDTVKNKDLHLIITPEKARVKPGEIVKFKVTAHDKNNKRIQVALQWSVEGGTMEKPGIFRAGPTAGRFQVRVIAAKAFAEAEITIIEISRKKPKWLTLNPTMVRLTPGQKFSFKARAVDKAGIPLDVPLKWMAEGGKIDNGVYIAGKIEGKYLVTVQTSGGLEAKGSVIIGKENAAPKRKLSVIPSRLQLQSGEKRHIAIEVIDTNGNKIKGRYQIEATGGKIDSSGNYTAGKTPGSYSIMVTELNNNLKQSIPVTILAKAVSKDPIQIDTWIVGNGTRLIGKLHIKGRIYDEKAHYLQLMILQKNGNKKVLSQVRTAQGQGFEFRGAYVRDTTKMIGLKLYDKKLNLLYNIDKQAK